MNPSNPSPPDQPPLICPVSDSPTELVLTGLPWCRNCECGWPSPKTYAKRRGIRPRQARQEIVERLPWHHRGMAGCAGEGGGS